MPRPAPKRRNIESAYTKSKVVLFASESVAYSNAAKIESDPFTIPGSVSVTPEPNDSGSVGWRVAWKTNA